jgi:ABC-2 type transport system permease protein
VVAEASDGMAERFATRSAMLSSWRLALLSFRALFNWLAPGPFLLTMVATPSVELIFYSFLGESLGAEDDKFFLIGGACLAACTPAVAGGVMALTSERYYGTLEQLLLSQRSRGRILLLRAVPYSAIGLLAAALTLALGGIFLGTPLAPAEIMLFIFAVALGCLSSTFLGMALGVLGLIFKNVFMLINVTIMTIALGAGLIVPESVLPGWVRALSYILPLHSACAAIRAVPGEVANMTMLATRFGFELVVAVMWVLIMLFSFRYLESRLRHDGK